MSASENLPFCDDLFNRKRFNTREVKVGITAIGGNNPIRVQSMTTTDTMDTAGSVEQSIRMIDAGCELVRLTAPSKKEAENLGIIKAELVKRGYNTPLVADIHFTPNAAEIAARLIEKVRVNPGNYADKKKFEEIDYNDESYAAELVRIEEKFTPLVLICKEHGTAMRIGTNHGSLSDRILSRYGDTPEGMVISAMEFIEICRKNDYHDLVISMKASNTLVMVQAYRLLVATMKSKGMNYPLHLGVTEAGDGEDGRIKSAVGIGALLEDGIGDTIRVSLTEDPEFEIPVAQKLVEKFNLNEQINLNYSSTNKTTYYSRQRRESIGLQIIGNKHVPVVVADFSHKAQIKPTNLFGIGYNYSVELDKWSVQDLAADILYIGNHRLDFEVPGMLRIVQNYSTWKEQSNTSILPLCTLEQYQELGIDQEAFVLLSLDEEFSMANLPSRNVVFVISTSEQQRTQKIRKFQYELAENNNHSPVILQFQYKLNDVETTQLYAGSDAGIHFIDGFGDGIWITANIPTIALNSLSFGILQATRTRISKTEYISCPSCGRTLFDLQETTAKIRSRTSHLKGIKIGIMGCIVNGPGEMADADYGYVGTGPGKINLYKEKTVVRKNVSEDEAVDALIELIREHGDWVEIQP
ncbi:MAG: 4-hydroxy-3-methylbut-2-en-1-yl diphosphate synthase [Candidatus Fluviicola riflensis]|nr:MAG: 4-hydroxy-3-methylbut-2-en-1-yl diphosphate synthase [Candidatus Fluviicola riflensis]OGS78122.1 MAG: 4-hydroxy-3-methylbut-2-en-1-yl diphosphate synthase [Candidatus Fluviicola riflensis]OGS85188.1 MAG: 4-hydroxy-3-methylbut-2-en-1-yl diphosphate synthase [Fluviicola sp. RIFCSPHIGHO2_01_FULL_43_53]OGS89459.1 MAG: 4-hydroxy-3-methylbut-2-en-1-yl diphosphate synthase [Fluviicola sp. RIFCSPHIGHO2_12_FULL_43_24]